MSVHEDPLLSRKRLRISLRHWREQRALTQEQVAEALDWSQSKVVRIESGKVRVSATEARALLGLYQVSDQDEVARLVELARVARRRAWYRDYEHALDLDYDDYLSYESSALAIETFQQLLVPGLLQDRRLRQGDHGGEWGHVLAGASGTEAQASGHAGARGRPFLSLRDRRGGAAP